MSDKVDPKTTLYPITVLMDELKTDDKKKKIDCIKNLDTVAIALGAERTRNELMPYIMDLMDDDEEVLGTLAEVLNGDFLDHVGGPLFAPNVFKPLERLCEVEEVSVKDKAVKSIKHIFTLINIKEMKHQILQMIGRLMNSETFNSKTAAIQLFPVIYEHMSPSH